MWPARIKEQALIACGRRCCLCHAYCGVRIELHHIVAEAEGGQSTLANCIPLCFNCHADVGHYNPKHPKGSKFTPGELRAHRDRWFEAMARLTAAEVALTTVPFASRTVYEGQRVELIGFVWREAFPGPPNFESLETDTPETYWMLVLPEAVSLIVASPENGASYTVEGIKRVQLMLQAEHYERHRHLVLHDAHVIGRLQPNVTGHHHGDALLEVEEIRASDGLAPIDLTGR